MAQRRNPYAVDVANEFLQLKLAREPKTYAAYSGILVGSERGTKKPLGLPFAVYFHNRRFDSLEPGETALWFSQRVRGGSHATKHRISKNSRAFLRWARERGYTKHDLASPIPIFPSPKPRVEWLEWSDVHQLLAAIPEYRYRVATEWLFYTGCRVEEAVAATHRDLRERNDGRWQWVIPDSKTHEPRAVWLPDNLGNLIRDTRRLNTPKRNWPILWDCDGRGFGRTENPAAKISPRTINAALERARDAINLPIHVTAHVAKHTYCTNWVTQYGDGEIAMEMLRRQVGTSVEVLRRTYVHITLNETDWLQIRNFGAR